MTARDIPAVDRLLKRAFQAHRSPIIELVEAQTHDPFCVLVGTILSARTKDQCTAGAVRRLFAAGAGDVFTPADLDRLTQAEIEKLIFPVGFFRDKARHLKALPGVLREKFGGVLPQTVEELCELPGVGRKTANIVLNVGYGIVEGIAVDTHVNRIAHRLMLSPKTHAKEPLKTEQDLLKILPHEYWESVNHQWITFGREICDARKPKCDECPLADLCPSVRVG